MLNELLTRVSMPASNRLEQLREAMMEGFPAAVIAPLKNGLWPKEPAPWRLYVNQAFQEAYGYLDLRKPDHLTYNTERRHRSIAPQLAHDVLQRIIQWIRQSAPPEALATTATLVQWLKEESAAFDVPGILPTLEAAPADQRHSTLVIGFANGQASRLVQALGEQGISDAMIWGAAKYAKDDKDFVHKLEREYRKTTSKHLILAKEAAEQLRAGFEKLRDDQDTYKAVHRLTLLGVVADYTLDYGAKTITLCLNRRPDDEREYTERLKQYLNRYTTTAKADELATQAAQRTGSSLLTKLLDALLDFTYGEIADKRRRAAKEMSLACERSLAAPDEDLGEFFDLYFNSKYARAEYLPSDTQAGAYFDRALIWQYLDYMTDPPDGLGKERDNVKHLRGACARMFSTTGAYSNGALLLLDGFALLFLEIERKTVSPKIVAAAADKILQGCYHFREHEHLDDEGLLKFFDEYAARTSTIEPGLASYLGVSIRQTLLLDHYRRWLSVFNSRFDDRPSRAAEQLPDPSTGAAA